MIASWILSQLLASTETITVIFFPTRSISLVALKLFHDSAKPPHATSKHSLLLVSTIALEYIWFAKRQRIFDLRIVTTDEEMGNDETRVNDTSAITYEEQEDATIDLRSVLRPGHSSYGMNCIACLSVDTRDALMTSKASAV